METLYGGQFRLSTQLIMKKKKKEKERERQRDRETERDREKLSWEIIVLPLNSSRLASLCGS